MSGSAPFLTLSLSKGEGLMLRQAQHEGSAP